MEILALTNVEKGRIIAIILLIILFSPLIIYAIKTKIKENETKKIFGYRVDKKEKKNKQQYINQQQQNQQYINQQYKQNYNEEWLPYRLKESVMTNREKIMYNILAKYCNKNNLVLMSKVRIADFVEPIHTNNRRNFYHWFNQISAKHVDYLICDPNTLRPKAAIELDDSTHNYQSRRKRDIFVDNVYKSVQLPILHFWDMNEISINIQLNELFGIKSNKA